MKVVSGFYDKETGKRKFYTREQRYATIISDWLDRDKGADVKRYRRYFKLFGIKPSDAKGKLVVDIGCGAWGGILPLVPKAKRRIAVDDFIPYFEIGNLWDYTGEYLTDNGKHIRIQSSVVDCVACLNVLDHCDNTGTPAKIVKEIHRILKPYGRAYIFCHLREGTDLNIMHLYGIEEHDLMDWFKDFHIIKWNILGKDAVWDRDHKTFVGVFRKK